jgi:hypothetical protein
MIPISPVSVDAARICRVARWPTENISGDKPVRREFLMSFNGQSALNYDRNLMLLPYLAISVDIHWTLKDRHG